MDWTTASWASGPELYNWLEEQGELERARMTKNGRRLWSWKRGDYASLQAVDKLMSMLGRHISEIPDAVWSNDMPRSVSPGPRITHCKRGHLYDDENTIARVGSNGRVHRECRACKKLKKLRIAH